MCSEVPIATMTDSTSITIVSTPFLFIHSFFHSLIQNNFYFVDCVVLWCGVVCVLFCVAMYDIVSFRRILVEGFKNRISNNRDKFDVIR